MTTKKIIIKNCPAVLYKTSVGGEAECFETWDDNGDTKPCKDVTDCKLKKMVTLCETELLIANYWWGSPGAKDFSHKILQILDVHEVNE